MTALGLLVGFVLFMAVIATTDAVNRFALRHHGYAPFALPNAALMTIPCLLLLSALRPLAEAPGGVAGFVVEADPEARIALVEIGLWALFTAGMIALLWWRTRAWVALYAGLLLAVAAPVLLLSLLFKRLAGD